MKSKLVPQTAQLLGYVAGFSYSVCFFTDTAVQVEGPTMRVGDVEHILIRSCESSNATLR